MGKLQDRIAVITGASTGIGKCIVVSILHPGNSATPIWSGREEIARQEAVMSQDAKSYPCDS